MEGRKDEERTHRPELEGRMDAVARAKDGRIKDEGGMLSPELEGRTDALTRARGKGGRTKDGRTGHS